MAAYIFLFLVGGPDSEVFIIPQDQTIHLEVRSVIQVVASINVNIEITQLIAMI